MIMKRPVNLGFSMNSIMKVIFDPLHDASEELKKSNKAGETSVTMTLSKRVDMKKATNGHITECYIYMNAHYFTRRECISFNRNGWIGFAGWAGDGNTNPLRRAFLAWCDYLAEGGEADGKGMKFWDALKEHAHRNHQERVSKNPDRIAYAIQQFEAHGIEYQLKNPQTGHFHCWRKSDDQLFQFYAGTGKIQGLQTRGIHNLIKLLEG